MAFRLRFWTDEGKVGKGVWRWWKKEIIYLSLHCHHQNESCIKMGSDESHFNVSLIVRDKVTRQYPQTQTFLKRKESQSRIKPRPFCLPAQCLATRPNWLTPQSKKTFALLCPEWWILLYRPMNPKQNHQRNILQDLASFYLDVL